MKLRLLLALSSSLLPALGAVACSGAESSSAATSEGSTQTSGLKKTIEDLASFGNKRIGTPEGAKAAQYIEQRMLHASLRDVHYEQFAVPVHTVQSSAMTITVDGRATPLAFEVFEASGSGNVQDAPIVYLGSGKPQDYDGKDVTGKVVFVKRDNQYHRSSQFANAAQHGAAAMLYQSTVPNNQIQIGSVRDTWEAMGTIPAISIGGDDGDKLQQALSDGHDVRASMQVVCTSQRGIGRNVVGLVPGKNYGKVDASGASLDRRVIIGAHYDTWYTGSLDNGSGVAAMLYFAGKRGGTAGRLSDATLVFVAYDGEETGLYGGYDYLRKHQDDGILAVVNFEMPAAEADFSGGFVEGIETLVKGVAASQIDALHDALEDSRTTGLFDVFQGPVSLDFVERQFGGIIPTDIQGIYRSGVPTVSTASDSPYYHTTQDTPDKVDYTILAHGVQAFDRAVLDLGNMSSGGGISQRDPTLWNASVDVAMADPQGDAASVAVTLYDESGSTLASTAVSATLFCDDYFARPAVVQPTDASGNVTFTFTGLTECAANRYVHVSAGKNYPLVEKVRALPGNVTR